MNQIQQWKYAVEVEKTGSISKAAENLYMNQPNLSKAIRDLEGDLGITLFSRTAKGAIPTERGREFLMRAKQILAQIDEVEALYKPSEQEKLCFDICVPRASYASHAFTAFIEALDPNAEISVNYRETDSMEAIREVSESSHTLAIVRYPTCYESYFLSALRERQLAYEPIWEFSRLALMSRRHPLAGQSGLNASLLKNYTEILHGTLSIPALPLSEARQLAQAQERKRAITVYERGSQFELLNRVPTTYMWVSPTPTDVLERFGLVQKRCSSAHDVWKDILIRREGYHYTREDALFLDKIRQTIATLQAER